MDAIPTETDAARALGVFVRHVAGDDVRVTLTGGIALLEGVVASPTARRALVDLVRAHGGVTAVRDHLRVDPAPKPAREAVRRLRP